jgi:hypothetical protein
MEGLTVSLLKDLPGYAPLILGAIALGFSVLLHFRKMDLDQITSIGNMQSSQLASLQILVRNLTEDLMAARTQLTEIHDQNLQLKEKVAELELIVLKYQSTHQDTQPAPLI